MEFFFSSVLSSSTWKKIFLQTCFFWPSTKLLHILLGAAPTSTRAICWHGSGTSDLSAPGCSWAGARADASRPSTSAAFPHHLPSARSSAALVPAPRLPQVERDGFGRPSVPPPRTFSKARGRRHPEDARRPRLDRIPAQCCREKSAATDPQRKSPGLVTTATAGPSATTPDYAHRTCKSWWTFQMASRWVLANWSASNHMLRSPLHTKAVLNRRDTIWIPKCNEHWNSLKTQLWNDPSPREMQFSLNALSKFLWQRHWGHFSRNSALNLFFHISTFIAWCAGYTTKYL